jgi:hypothetical protein
MNVPNGRKWAASSRFSPDPRYKVPVIKFVLLSDTEALTRMEEHDWLDWGKDYYATASFNNSPNGKRVMLGWMNNWDYGQATPTTTWRGTMALPPEVVLTQTPKGPRLRQKAVTQMDTLKNTAAAYTAQVQDIRPGTVALPISRDMVQIEAEFSPGTASSFGLKAVNPFCLHRQNQLRQRGLPSRLRLGGRCSRAACERQAPPADLHGPGIRGSLCPGRAGNPDGPGLSRRRCPVHLTSRKGEPPGWRASLSLR